MRPPVRWCRSILCSTDIKARRIPRDTLGFRKVLALSSVCLGPTKILELQLTSESLHRNSDMSHS
jgi:hypothetical protein